MPKPEFVLVPREPTEEMIRRAWANVTVYNPVAVYREMLNSAPPSPSVDEEMLEALKPLAALADVFDSPGGTTPTRGEIYTWSRMVNGEPKDFTLTVEMLRAARAAITRATGGKE